MSTFTNNILIPGPLNHDPHKHVHHQQWFILCQNFAAMFMVIILKTNIKTKIYLISYSVQALYKRALTLVWIVSVGTKRTDVSVCENEHCRVALCNPSKLTDDKVQSWESVFALLSLLVGAMWRPWPGFPRLLIWRWRSGPFWPCGRPCPAR